VIALIEFPSVEAAQAFADDPEYAPHKAARIAGTVSKLNLIDDTDAMGANPYLARG
jgi:uncharacterized protein (DUF1330 family)